MCAIHPLTNNKGWTTSYPHTIPEDDDDTVSNFDYNAEKCYANKKKGTKPID